MIPGIISGHHRQGISPGRFSRWTRPGAAAILPPEARRSQGARAAFDLDGPMDRPAVQAELSEHAPPHDDRAAARRNYLLGSLNGVIGNVSMDFIHPELILSGLVMALTGSVYGVALVNIINKLASLMPQLSVGSFVEHRPRKRPFYVMLIAVRVVSVGVILGTIWEMASGGWGVQAAFFAAYFVWCLCGGAGHVIFLDMVGRLIPLSRVGGFFGIREFLGGVLSLVAGWLIIQPILDRNLPLLAAAAPPVARVAPAEGSAPPASPASPVQPSRRPIVRVEQPEARRAVATNYLVLAVVGGALSVLAMGFLALCREQAGPMAVRPTTLEESLRRGFQWLREDADYRAYLWLRIAFRFTYLGLAFFIPFGVRRLTYEGSPLGVVALGGIMLTAIKTSRVVSSILWGKVVDRSGDRVCLVWTGAFFTLGPVLMLLAPVVPRVFRLPVPLTDVALDLPLCVYLAALVAVGAAFQGSIIGGNRFLIGNAPPDRRISYIGFLNTVTSPLTLLPALAALVAAHLGLTVLFVAIAAGGVLFLYWAWRLSPDVPPVGAANGAPPPPESAA
jgi:hypothetical protein